MAANEPLMPVNAACLRTLSPFSALLARWRGMAVNGYALITWKRAWTTIPTARFSTKHSFQLMGHWRSFMYSQKEMVWESTERNLKLDCAFIVKQKWFEKMKSSELLFQVGSTDIVRGWRGWARAESPMKRLGQAKRRPGYVKQKRRIHALKGQKRKLEPKWSTSSIKTVKEKSKLNH